MDTPKWQDIGLTEDDWKPIDQAIFARRIILGIQLLRERTKLSLRESIDVQHGRHLHLRSVHPGSFACSLEEYYRDVYA
jgi:hypothetical protein